MDIRISLVDGRYVVSDVETFYIHVDEVKAIVNSMSEVLEIVNNHDFDKVKVKVSE